MNGVSTVSPGFDQSVMDAINHVELQWMNVLLVLGIVAPP
jgi:hypothetical protein